MTGDRVWSGRFSTAPAGAAHALGSSLRFDVRLASQDVEASIAHVRALEDVGLLSAEDAKSLEAALADVGHEIAEGRLGFDERDEDVHSAIERAVTDRLGELGARLHAGRSRNDLVITDLRLWLMAAGRAIERETVGLIRVLVEHARGHAGDPLPGMTHGRAAQPVTLGHHLLAHASGLARDLERLEGWSSRASTSPLGAGAIATSTLGLDPDMTAARLGFHRAFANSIDAVSDRDVVQEFLAVAAILATHVSRLAADLLRWTDPSLGWAELDEAYSTGSSMMPHKRNPDTAELARAKAARIAGDFATVTALLQGLPLGYHRDLQEDKEPVLDAADTLERVLPALTGAVRTVRFDTEAMRAACEDEGLYATDLAEALVKSGVPFREAHRRTGALLKGLAERGSALRELGSEEWAAFGVPHGRTLLDPDRSIAARSGPGGPSRASVEHQAEMLEAFLDARPIQP
ncbi:MAG: argininosuccinate lyase [Actinomycetota bacterium]